MPDDAEARIAALIADAEEYAEISCDGHADRKPRVRIDKINHRAVKSDILASVITERSSRVRVLGKSEILTLNASALVLLTGNGVSVSEDLARRFIAIELDPRTEDPESRSFSGDIRAEVRKARAELLAAALTIWRWGRLHASEIGNGMPFGSFDQWSTWVRDPLLALGCRDPAMRAVEAKQGDVRRQELVETFKLWFQHHGHRPTTANGLHPDVSASLNPQERDRRFLARKLQTLAGTRLAGMVLTREKTGHWSAATYALLRAEDCERHRGHRGDEPIGQDQSQ